MQSLRELYRIGIGVERLWETGNNLPSLYRETASGGLATAYRRRQPARYHP
jgi:hypothetical protein